MRRTAEYTEEQRGSKKVGRGMVLRTHLRYAISSEVNLSDAGAHNGINQNVTYVVTKTIHLKRAGK